MLTREEFVTYLDKYVSNTISPAKRSEFFDCITSGAYDDLLLEHFEFNLQANNAEGANLAPHRSAEILHKIISSEKQNAVLLPKITRRAKLIRWSIAAAAAVIIGIVFSIYLIRSNNTNAPVAFNGDMKESKNTSTQPLKIEMEEGSIITLQPSAVIHYPNHFLANKREIFLEGEAFFEVSKNAARPFFVYNKNIVTHVLGTSFNVKVNKETGNVEVAVRTGRVEVYENHTAEKNNNTKKSNGVILLPNQKVVYDEGGHQFVPSLVDKPLLVIKEAGDKKIITQDAAFDETPLKTVLPKLEKNYGIEIVVENEALYKCLFTGDLNEQDFYTKLDIICKAIGASYEVKGTKILIKGKGCN